ncbi:MAG: M28 family peptidase, partial [Planctomycetota bacterium]
SAAPAQCGSRPVSTRVEKPDRLPEPDSAAVEDLRVYFDELGPDGTLWYQHVQVLADPMLEGRAPGTRGGELTVEYLEFYLRDYGLVPPFAEDGVPENTYRQPLSIEGAPVEGFADDGTLAIAGKQLTAGTDFVLTANSARGDVAAPVTFVGYGIEQGPGGYTSFGADTDLSGRVALLFRLEPLTEEGSVRWGDEPGDHSSLRTKFDAIAKRGAAGIILVNPPGAEYDLLELDPLPVTVGYGCSALTRIPTATITREAAEYLLAAADARGRDLLAWRRLADEGKVETVDLDDGVYVTLHADIRRAELGTANVAGALPGKGSLKDEWIVVGGHHDHVGHETGGGILPSNSGQLHPGADDNASGTAAVLVLAKRLATRYAEAPDDADLRSILFVGFAAEETGLNGSRHLVENPPVPLDRIYFMLNLDMVGRLRQNTLWVQGAGTATELPDVIGPLFVRSDLNVVTEAHIAGSDQVSFVNAGVPALFAMTGTHDELHTPLDQARTMNPRGAIRVVDLMQQLLLELAAHQQALTFVPQEAGGPVSCSGPGSADKKVVQPSSGCGGQRTR